MPGNLDLLDAPPSSLKFNIGSSPVQMGVHQPASVWGFEDLTPSLVNSQLFGDKTHSCFIKMRRERWMHPEFSI